MLVRNDVYRRWRTPTEEQDREHRWALGVLERGILARTTSVAAVVRMFVMTCEPLPAWGSW